MGRTAIKQLLFEMDYAFEGYPQGTFRWHSLMGNIESVRPDEWAWVPGGGKRSVRDIVEHLGARYVWDNQAFGDGSMTWSQMPFLAPGASREATISWVRQAFEQFRGHVAELDDDAQLLEKRRTPQGVLQETRWIVSTMIQHDLYHSGEINHIRALCQGDDE